VRAILLAPLLALALVACGDDDGAETAATTVAAKVPDRFDSGRAWRLLKYQVALGPRPAGSRPSRKLAAYIHKRLPNSSYQQVPDGLRNVIGRVPGRQRDHVIIVGAHYDTKDIPGFVGANDGASGTAVALRLAQEIKPRTIDPTLLFMFFDGEETPRGTPDRQFEKKGLRGSKVAARRYAGSVDGMVLLDFVGDRDLSIPHEDYSDKTLWAQLRAAASRVGAGKTFPADLYPGVLDDHLPFIQRGVPAIDLIDFDFACWHKPCDDLSAVSERSLDRVGETMRDLLPRL
jgi:Peptidase family M28